MKHQNNKIANQQKNYRKIRRGGKRIKNKLQKFKLLYANLRGFKSKRRSIQEIIEEEKPTLMAFTETLLEEKEEINLQGYKIIKPEKKDQEESSWQ